MEKKKRESISIQRTRANSPSKTALIDRLRIFMHLREDRGCKNIQEIHATCKNI